MKVTQSLRKRLQKLRKFTTFTRNFFIILLSFPRPKRAISHKCDNCARDTQKSSKKIFVVGILDMDRTSFLGPSLPAEVKGILTPALAQIDQRVFRKMLEYVVEYLKGTEITDENIAELQVSKWRSKYIKAEKEKTKMK